MTPRPLIWWAIPAFLATSILLYGDLILEMGWGRHLSVLVGIFATLHAQDCQTTSVLANPPTDGGNVALSTYSYCGGNLNATVYIANLCYNKLVNLAYSDRQNTSTPLTSLSLGYLSSIPDTNYELWGANVAIYVDGISELLNLTYQAVDINQSFDQQLGQEVVASGAPEPTLPGPPAPYASPLGLSDDITAWLQVDTASQITLAKQLMFNNINPQDVHAANGTIVAARSGPDYDQKLPDYEYTWVRDTALTFDVVERMYNVTSSSDQAASYAATLAGYAAQRANQQTQPGLLAGGGEVKFYMNGTVYTGPWGRPQADGPASAASTLIDFANDYLAKGGDVDFVKSQIYDSSSNTNAPVQRDLLFVANQWTQTSFDLWEEEQSIHFYTRMVQRRALLQGATFATAMGDSATSDTLSAAASSLTATLSQFWDPNRDLLLYEYGPVMKDKASYKDVAIALGVIHGSTGDDVYGPANDQVLSSLLQIATSFLPIYGISSVTADASGGVLGIPIGRYPEDVYNGTGTAENGGNPWYLATTSMAEVFYRAVQTYRAAGSIAITDTSLPFFQYFAPSTTVVAGGNYAAGSAEFTDLTDALLGWGDAFLRRVKYHVPEDGHLAEEFNRDTGVAQGAADLTWSYAALITAALARADVAGDTAYAQKLADFVIS